MKPNGYKFRHEHQVKSKLRWSLKLFYIALCVAFSLHTFYNFTAPLQIETLLFLHFFYFAANPGDPRNSWLAPRPLNPQHPNSVYIVFPHPQVISAILLTNYAKTPSRGAKLVNIFLDDSIIFQGFVR